MTEGKERKQRQLVPYMAGVWDADGKFAPCGEQPEPPITDFGQMQAAVPSEKLHEENLRLARDIQRQIEVEAERRRREWNCPGWLDHVSNAELRKLDARLKESRKPWYRRIFG